MTLSNGNAMNSSDINNATDDPIADINAYRSHKVTHTVAFTGDQGEDFYFTPDDDYEVLGFYAMETEPGNVYVTIDTENIAGESETTPVLELTPTAFHTAAGRGTWTIQNLQPTTGDKLFMLKGVTYRLRITTATASAAIVLALKVKIRPYFGAIDQGKPWMVKGNTTLTPSIVNSMYASMDNIARRSRRARFFTHPFVLRFKAINSSTAEGLRKFHFTMPTSGSTYAKCDITGIDIAIKGYSGSEEEDAYKVSLLQGSTVYGEQTFDGPDSDVFSYQVSRMNTTTSDVSTDQEYTVLVESTATNARDVFLTVHLRSNVRIGTGTGDADFTYSPVETGDTNDADEFNTVLTAWQTVGTDLQTQKKAIQIEVLEITDSDISAGVIWALPGIPSRTLARVEVYGTGGSATTLQCNILDEAGAAVGTNPKQLSITGSTADLDGPTTENDPSGGVMLVDADITDSNDDFTLELVTTTSVTVNRAIAVLYWVMDVV